MIERSELPFSGGVVVREPRSFAMMDGAVLRALRYEPVRLPRKGARRWQPRPTSLLVLPDPDTTMRSVEPFILALLAREDAPRVAWTFDARGRGLSQPGSEDDRTPEGAAADLVAICDGANLHHVDIVAYGKAAFTLLASAPRRPTLARRIVLNDGAAEFDSVGLARLSALRKRLRTPRDWDEAATLVKDTTPGTFSALTSDDWLSRAKAVWHERDGSIALDAAKALSEGTAGIDLDGVQPSMWPEYAVLRSNPVMLVRGETSPLVTEALAAKMRDGHQRMEEVVAEGQGHIADLAQPALVQRIAEFLAA